MEFRQASKCRSPLKTGRATETKGPAADGESWRSSRGSVAVSVKSR